MTEDALRLAIVTADLRPGHSGVGDYSLSLARALGAQGQEVRLLSLAAEGESGRPLDLACSVDQPWHRRTKALKTCLAALEPDWVFLQLMPQLYHPRGWLGRIGPGLVRALEGQRLAVMVHELHASCILGRDAAPAARRRRQTAASLALLERMQPQAVMTSNALYRDRIASAGLAARVLPLFSHLPAGPEQPGAWLEEALRAVGLKMERERTAFLLAMGRLRADWEPFEALAALAAAARRRRRRPLLLVAGRSGMTAERLDCWRRRLPVMAFLDLGPQPARHLVQLLNLAQVLLTPTRYEILGKSSIAAAALAQGVPVLPSEGDPGSGEQAPPGFEGLFLRPGSDPAALFERRPGSGPFQPQLEGVAARLLTLLRSSA